MAQPRGFVKVMVAAPNQATNILLNTPGFQQETRKVAASLMPAIQMASYRESARRQPTMVTRQSISRFNGTVRGGTIIKGRQAGMRLQVVKNALGNKVTYR